MELYGINVVAPKNEHPRALGPTAWIRAWLAMLVLALCPLDARLPEAPAPFSPRGSCVAGASIRWHSVAPLADRDVLDRWCDSVGPPLVTTGAPPPDAVATVVVATWNVHA